MVNFCRYKTLKDNIQWCSKKETHFLHCKECKIPDVDIEYLRQQVQDLDKDLVITLNLRMKAAQDIINFKKSQGLSTYSPGVEEKKIAELANYSEFSGMVEALWPVIMCYARTL